MHLLIDMNLSPHWCAFLAESDIAVTHWSEVGDPAASDKEIFRYARNHHMIVFTHDLDFGDILAATGADSPSVIQVRTETPTPAAIGPRVIASLNQFAAELSDGALVTIDPTQSRARILPI